MPWPMGSAPLPTSILPTAGGRRFIASMRASAVSFCAMRFGTGESASRISLVTLTAVDFRI